MSYNPTEDKQRALDGDLGARHRIEVLDPYGKILTDFIKKVSNPTLSREEKDDLTGRMSDHFDMMVSTMLIIHFNAMGADMLPIEEVQRMFQMQIEIILCDTLRRYKRTRS